MIGVHHSGNFDNTMGFLNKMNKKDATAILRKYGERGVSLLAAATPRKTGKTAASWSYDINFTNGRYTLTWSNSNINDGINIEKVFISDIEDVHSILHSHPRWGGRLTNEFWIDIDK